MANDAQYENTESRVRAMGIGVYYKNIHPQRVNRRKEIIEDTRSETKRANDPYHYRLRKNR